MASVTSVADGAMMNIVNKKNALSAMSLMTCVDGCLEQNAPTGTEPETVNIPAPR